MKSQGFLKSTVFTRVRAFSIAALALVSLNSAWAIEVRVAVASNFAAPMRKIAEDFQRSTGHRTVVSLGSTGKFYAQIKNGAPLEILLAADEETPARLEKEGLAVPGTRFTYAVGHLALWSKEPGRVDANGDILRKAAGEKMAIGDPRLSPYGAAAMQVMEKLGVLALWQPRLAQGESMAQAYQFVASGNAAFGFVALSQVMEGGRITRGSAWIVPADLHAPLRQDAVILKFGRGNPAAEALVAYLKSEPARAVMRAYGYTF